MKQPALFDLIVLGAGPAGAAAAGLAAARGLHVALVDRNPSPRASRETSASVEWLNPAAHETLSALEMDNRAFVVGEVDRVRFMGAQPEQTSSAPLERSVELVWTEGLVASLVAAAESAGVTMFLDTPIVSIDAREDAVHLTSAAGDVIAGKLLIAADGGEGKAAEWLGVQREIVSRSDCCRWCAVETPRGKARLTEPVELNILLDSESLGRFSYACRAGGSTMLGVVSDGAGELDAAMASAMARFKTADVFAEDAVCGVDDTVRRRAVRGLALEMETHVGKRSLWVGDAGGFVCALSDEGLYPAIVSSALAVETCARALSAAHPQDALADFDTAWRREMVEYLRLPNVDLRFLLPLVFSNERMARKLAGAFVCGENL